MDAREPAPLSSIPAPSPFSPPKPFPQSMQLSFESQSDSPTNPYFHQQQPQFTPLNTNTNNNNNNNNTSGSNNINSNNNNNNEGGGGKNNSNSEGMKKKRGRPRKYGPDGGTGMGMGVKSGSGSGPGSVTGGSVSNPSFKKMGRPPGSSKKKQLEALGASGVAFTPHIITVPPGEDVASKIMAFSQQGPRTICILSANGAISNVSLRQAATSGGLVTYEGRFEIISLSGSFLLAQDGDTKSRTGGLSVALSGSDGRVLGGCVAGMLLAATPVQVVVGSFIAEGKKPKPNPPEPITSHSQPLSIPVLTNPHGPSPAQIRPGPPPHFGGPSPHNMNMNMNMNNNTAFNPAPPAGGSSPPSDVMTDDYSTSNENDDNNNDDDNDDNEGHGPIHHHVAPRFSDSGSRVTHFNHMGWPISSENSQNRRE